MDGGRSRSRSPGMVETRDRSRSPREAPTDHIQYQREVQLPANFRQGDWMCTNDACRAHNYSSKINCHKCNTPLNPNNNKAFSSFQSVPAAFPSSQTSASSNPSSSSSSSSYTYTPNVSRGGSSGNSSTVTKPDNFRQGDWMCPCSAHNYSSKFQCHKCNLPKAVATNVQKNFRQGDWMCPCGAHNYATKSQCHKCGLAKGMAALSANLGFGGYLGNPVPVNTFVQPQLTPTPANFRPGDWLCTCGAHNYASKSACHKCNLPRQGNPSPLAPGLDAFGNLAALANLSKLAAFNSLPSMQSYSFNGVTGSSYAPAPSLPANFRQGDWLCACSAHNYASKAACHKCGVPKPDTEPQIPSQPALPANFRPGDWLCSCSAHNYASKVACHKCNQPKPDNA